MVQARRRPQTIPAEESRQAILSSAIREFAQSGFAGARTEAIARCARVNKALLYYYYDDKEMLYEAALESVMVKMSEALRQSFNHSCSPGEQLLSHVAAHFDFIADHPMHRRLFQNEMTMFRSGGGSRGMRRLITDYLAPIFHRLERILEEGMATGEFRIAEPSCTANSVIAVVVFCFSSAPVARLLQKADPLAPKHLAQRRTAVLEFVANAVFAPGRRPEKLTPGAKHFL